MASEPMPIIVREHNGDAARIIMLANEQALMFTQAQTMHAIQHLIEMLRQLGREDELIAQMADGDFSAKLHRFKENQYQCARFARCGRRQ